MIAMVRRSESGFSLVETLAAITIFAMITVGVVPLLASSLRGAALARSFTVAKNLAQESMERVRGFPYFDTAPHRDVLDLYFPNLSTGYVAGTQTFTTTCTATSSTPAPSAPLACPPDHVDGTSTIPAGYTVFFDAQFVRPTNTTPESFQVQTPPAGYDSNVGGSSIPPAQFILMTVRTEWLQGGLTKKFQLKSLLGDRKLTPDKARANASVDFVVQSLTSFMEENGRQSGMRAVLGRSSSSIEIRNFATADTDANAGRFTLTRDEFGGTPGSVLADVSGAQGVFHAPPDTNPLPHVTAPAQTATHPDLGQPIASLGTTEVNASSTSPSATVPSELPLAATSFSMTGGVGEQFWVANQAAPGLLGLHIFPGGQSHILALRRESGPTQLSGETVAFATATDPAASRKIEATANARFSKLQIMPATFTSGLGGVVEIDNFTASFGCSARGSAGSPTATGTWSATLRYWRDPTPNGLTTDASYVSVAISGSTTPGTPNPLASIGNPLVKDALSATDRVYLFDNPATSTVGYLSSMAITPLIPSSTTAATANVGMDSAISIVTGLTNPENTATKLAVAVGKLSCRAVDQRG